LAADGSEISSVPIPFDLDEDQDVSFSNLSRDGSGNLLASAGSTLIAVSPEGSIAYVIDCGDLVSGVIRLRDGRVCAVVWGSSGLTLHPIDADKAALGEGIALPPNTYNLLSGGGDYDLFWRSGSFLYGMKLASGETEQILNWINCDINGDKISALDIAADGTITGVLDGTRRTELFRLNKVPTASLPEKKTLTLAVMYLEYDMSDLIIDFNRHNDRVRIEVRDYSGYNTETDFSAGLTKLNTEIMSGRMPDLLSLNALPFSQLAGKGLLADLYPYLDADKELAREDLFPTVLKAMEVSGGLYRICPSFTVHSLIGAASVVGDKPGWNYEQFRDALASMPEGCTPLEPYTSRDEVLTVLVDLDMNDFVDWTTGRCSFDSQEFVDLLKFANSFLPDLKWADYDWFENDTAPVRIAQGRQMLLRSMISDVDDVLYYDFMFGGESSYIGWPTNSGAGNMLSLDDHAYAMSASCADKEAGWEFLRALLLDDYQETVYSLPVMRRVFDERLAKAMEVNYQKDDNGNYVLNESGEKVPIPRVSYSTGDGASQDFYALTREQADKLLELIGTTERVMEENNGILAIVRQGAAAYFAGQKRPEEVARLVQSRINIYVNEHR
ncbi:MAG: extracellular solute-binding protein, partial [Oscillospiraceae bacterium]|nr:extracellular solute-binding protein [Oscillospiraceae bacterium]